MRVVNMGLFGNQEFDDLFGGIFGMTFPENQAKQLDDYWQRGKVKEYYDYLNTVKSSGRKVFRSDKTGKHIVR